MCTQLLSWLDQHCFPELRQNGNRTTRTANNDATPTANGATANCYLGSTPTRDDDDEYEQGLEHGAVWLLR